MNMIRREELSGLLGEPGPALVMTYCSPCRRSRTAAGLERLGYTNVPVHESGTTGWAEAGQPWAGTCAHSSAGEIT